jgi:sulfur relay (sulfurtransferase) DsrC/TusE family protein
LNKIFAGRPRNFEDIKSIVHKNPDLNRTYIRKWLKEFEESPEKKMLLKAFEEAIPQSTP